MWKSFSRTQKVIIVSMVFCWFYLIMSCGPCEDFEQFVYYWIRYLHEDGLFLCYSHLEDAAHYLNYPPLYIIYLYAFRKPVLWGLSVDLWVGLFLLKFGMMLFHIWFSGYLYKRVNQQFAWFWFLNPVFLIISTTTIHIDEVFCAVLVLFLMAFQNKKPMHVVFWFTIACLLKLQGCYLLPVLFVYFYLNRIEWRKNLQCFCIGLCMGVLVYLPFMISIGSWDLPLRVYLNGFYSDGNNMQLPITIHGLFMYVTDIFFPQVNRFVFGPVHGYMSTLMLLLVVFGFLYLVYKKIDISLAVFAYFYGLFYLTYSQHWRYFVYAIVLAGYAGLVLQIQECEKLFLKQWFLFMLLMLSTFVWNNTGFLTDTSYVVVSFLVYIVLYVAALMTFVSFVRFLICNVYNDGVIHRKHYINDWLCAILRKERKKVR